MNEEVWKWNVNLAWELFTSGIYFYRKALNSKFEHQKHMYYKNGLLSIVTSVEVYINQLLISEEKWSKSKIKDTKIEKMPFLEEITLEKHKECKNCWARNLCVGACPNENLVNAGTTQKSDSKNCRFIQAMYNDLIHAYLELTVENKKQLLG